MFEHTGIAMIDKHIDSEASCLVARASTLRFDSLQLKSDMMGVAPKFAIVTGVSFAQALYALPLSVATSPRAASASRGLRLVGWAGVGIATVGLLLEHFADEQKLAGKRVRYLCVCVGGGRERLGPFPVAAVATRVVVLSALSGLGLMPRQPCLSSPAAPLQTSSKVTMRFSMQRFHCYTCHDPAPLACRPRAAGLPVL